MAGLRAPSITDSQIRPAIGPEADGTLWARTVTTDPWDPAILTLDGGGIRGYSSLLILKALMHEIAVWEKKLEKEDRYRRDSARDAHAGSAFVQVHADLRLPRSRRTSRSSQSGGGDGSSGGLLSDNQSMNAPRIPSGLRHEERLLSPHHVPSGSALAASDTLSTRSSLSIPDDGPAQALRPPSPPATFLEANGDNPEGLSDFEDNLLPCHYFDFMYGTSTGGLIATMLGRLRMSIPQCLKIYREVSDGLFGKRRSRLPLTTKYYSGPLELAVKKVVAQYCKQHGQDPPNACDGDDWNPWDAAYPELTSREVANFNRDICQSICLTAVHNGKIDVAHLLRTYDMRYDNIPNWATNYNEGADRLRIWQVTRATSAAPFYFKALQADVEGEPWSFKDGGIRENNPAGAAFSEVVSMYGEDKDPALLLSVGTGRPNEEKDGFAAAWPGPLGNSALLKKWAEKFAVLKNVLVKYTAGEEKHKMMTSTARGENTWYKRLNVSTGLESMPLDAWKAGLWTDPATGIESVVPGGETMTKIELCTLEYLERDWNHDYDSYARPSVMLTQVAEKLVRQRRARELLARQGVEVKRWDTYMGRYLTGQYVPEGDKPLQTKEVVPP